MCIHKPGLYSSLYRPCNDKAESAGVKSNLWYLESLFTQCTLVVHLGWPAQGYYDACGFCFLLTRSMQSAVCVNGQRSHYMSSITVLHLHFLLLPAALIGQDYPFQLFM